VHRISSRVTSATPVALRGFVGAFVAIALSAAPGPGDQSLAQDSTEWKTGAAFRKQLELPIGIKLGENPLRSALGRLSRAQGTAIFLDRRVDPDQKVDFSSNDEPFDLALAKLCGQLGLGKSIVGSVIYLGPADSAGKVATVAALRRKEAASLSASAKARWLKQDPLTWGELSTPGDVLDGLAKTGRFVVVGEVPHDVWPAYDLPALPLADRVSLLLAGFGLTYRFEGDGATVRLMPMPDAVEYEQPYTHSNPAMLVAELKRVLPALKIERRGSQVYVTGSYEDHERIERLVRGEKVKTVVPVAGEQRYTLEVKNQPAGAVVKTIASKLGKQLKYDASVLPKLRQEVQIKVTEVTLDELLRTTLEPLGLRWELTDTELVITTTE
jgi:hypothetical protein